MADKQPPPRGQHWLTDQQELAAIAGAVEVSAGDLVVEIGPGRGQLTDHLLAGEAGQVLAIEIDQELVGRLNRQYASELASGRLKLELADCRNYDWASLAPGWRLCANIPYYLAAFLLRQLTDTPNRPSTAVLLIPQPVAAKLEGGCGSLLAVVVGAQYEVELLGVIAPQAFDPPPRVDSQVIRLRDRGPEREAAIVDQWPELCRFWRGAFARPRQTLANNLKAAGYDRSQLVPFLEGLGLSGRCRPGDLSRQQWLELWAAIGRGA